MGKYSGNLSHRLRVKPAEDFSPKPGEDFLAWVYRVMQPMAAKCTKEILSEHIGVDGRNAYSELREWTGNRNAWVSDWAEKTGAECSRGCSACCHQNVMCDPMEAFEIAAHLSRRGTEEERATVLERIRAVAALPIDIDVRWGIACPLLKDGECSVYDRRPSSCRTMLSNSLAQCEASLRSKDMTMLVEMPVITLNINNHWVLGSAPILLRYIRQFQFMPVELCRALAVILPDFNDAYDRWASGEDILAGCRMSADQMEKTIKKTAAATPAASREVMASLMQGLPVAT
jgi:Fe-S-cluster containining protein